MNCKGLLLDIEGTLTHQGALIAGAAESLAWLHEQGLDYRLLTNITARSPATISAELAALGLAVPAQHIQTATTACVAWLRARQGCSSYLLVPDPVRPLFDGLLINERNPDYVVIGDIGQAFCYDNLNRVFRLLSGGARLIALQKNPFWFAADGPSLDCGAFVAALEYASGQTAQVTGKPSSLFFEMALQSIGCQAREVLVIGDDPGTDMAGASGIGVRSVRVLTGKSAGLQRDDSGLASYCLASIAGLPQLLVQL
ncbi:TIGR01458 family HAD-type hydrolase [Pseudomonas sp. 21LCFQ02]|uniref:TIGR01458 family HAD-type hydrolase n=1 Tax=Pseudomonas sp. 21LCFQ02 TaxID=2957505 RepID=UPI00209ACCE0|nr:TIGR01458 family HAD-type hydrolase [Pseudomonas sp. 21LCFQ02]MCO8169773.1 TIGR01458 family HAD-type hydrolase [Pseudomonas sp. 21LCFQ02]